MSDKCKIFLCAAMYSRCCCSISLFIYYPNTNLTLTLPYTTTHRDQTLYSDGGNFDEGNEELADAIIQLLVQGVKVALITAAG
jgi:hypothetical protein